MPDTTGTKVAITGPTYFQKNRWNYKDFSYQMLTERKISGQIVKAGCHQAVSIGFERKLHGAWYL